MKHLPRHSRVWGLVWGLALSLAACGEEPPAAPPAPTFELHPVVDPALAALEAELAADERAVDPTPEEDVRGLLEMLASSSGSMHDIALEEVAGMGDAAVPTLTAVLGAADTALEQRLTILEVLGAIDTPRAAELLFAELENGEPLARAHAAWRLGAGTQDWIVPRLILRLKYEKDHDAVIWIARSLARFGNYHGLGALVTVAFQSPDENLRASALARIEGIMSEVNPPADEEPVFADVYALNAAWLAGDPDGLLPTRPRSQRFAREVWRRLERLREFQLRGVDDSRWICANLGTRAAPILAEALHDSDSYTRVHVAQCLERMGRRAAGAVPELLAGLDEPILAPNAAAALGAIGDPRAEPALLARLEPEHEFGLRLACARALGGLGEQLTDAARARLRAATSSSCTRPRARACCAWTPGPPRSPSPSPISWSPTRWSPSPPSSPCARTSPAGPRPGTRGPSRRSRHGTSSSSTAPASSNRAKPSPPAPPAATS